MKFNILLCLILCFTQGCKKAEDNSSEGLANHHKSMSFEFKIGKVIIKTELAVLPKERERGLMFRESMDEEEGMFFVFESGSSQRFWMKNTRIPLDIGYISSDGVLIEIHKGKPYDLSGVPSHSNDIKFVLVGSSQEKKIYFNDVIKDIDQNLIIDLMVSLVEVSKMLKSRQLNPTDYNLPN